MLQLKDRGRSAWANLGIVRLPRKPLPGGSRAPRGGWLHATQYDQSIYDTRCGKNCVCERERVSVCYLERQRIGRAERRGILCTNVLFSKWLACWGKVSDFAE
jgi:hypothetical protein